MLSVNGSVDCKGQVELYEKGYGKDAAGIAKEALAYGTSTFLCLPTVLLPWASGKENNFDVVLIDTAGRMQDNEVRTFLSWGRRHSL